MGTILVQYSFHRIPGSNGTPQRVPKANSAAVTEYLEKLLTFLETETSVRKFRFEVGRATEAKEKLCSLPNNAKFDDSSDVLALRLWQKQRAVESGSIKVQEGDLLSLYFTNDGTPFVLLAKLEQEEILNRVTWQKDSGFPFNKNRLLKTCLCELSSFDGAWNADEVSIYDSNAQISRFWWQDFLELAELTDDARNSQRAFTAWKRLFESDVKPVSKLDYQILCNDVGVMFRRSTSYDHKDAVKQILGTYVPQNPNLDLKTLEGHALLLPKKFQSLEKRFDEKFTVDPKACNIRMRPIPLTPEIELHIKVPIEDLQDVVMAHTFDGKKGVFIVSDSGYNEVSP